MSRHFLSLLQAIADNRQAISQGGEDEDGAYPPEHVTPKSIQEEKNYAFI